jgi:peptidoglycan hydrolase-like protein with peptidoglycan-binding domain
MVNNSPDAPEPVEPSAPGTPQIAPPTNPLNAKTVERYKHTLLSVDAARRPNILPPASALATLNGLETEAVYKSAGAALLRAWNLAPVNGLPGGDTEEALVEFAKRNGLDAEPLTPTLQQLRNINLPAFVQLEVEGKLVWSALISANEEEVQLSGAMSELLKLDADDFEKVYTKQAILLWQDPNPGNRVMLLGQNTPDIAEFKKQLRTLGRIAPGNTDSRYDEETATAVSQIQSETGLWLDGKAGKQVRMVLMSWLTDVNTPTLGKREDTTPPVRHVSVRRPDATTAYSSSPVKTAPIAAPVAAPLATPVVSPAVAVAPPNPVPFRNTEPIRIPAPSPYAPRVETPDASVNMPQSDGVITLDPLETLTISTPLDATLQDTTPVDGDLENNE